ncbi:hypothetical protein CC85DRAFT_310563 [Cutaneotrichosporon oleaginosum]|uniref:Uncharacterized protein n=1 Tax=Cutaneotrichosporon oleaginosum TaxID=879819 RepID=A0A0J0XWL8_9TREE|nr:uncharacterized protein CC85DRAFT_310563 [Cutaneotrichosporon oleaginosum]KLT45460.1 hypothetical protein CC85DRAFT_310563 [Cutaneotrichosporon oleaginosum]TXT14584.1 hypothetical protein COLE_00777 [Cutaneotrichosporon oleaginosum]
MSPVAYSSAPLKQMKQPDLHAPPPQIALEDLTRRVRETSDRIQLALSPFAERVKTFAEARPVIFTFTSIFIALSCIPAVCTAIFVLCVSALFTGIAIFLLCLSIVGTIGLAMFFLIPVLVIMASLSAMAVGVLLALFLAHRLYLHIRSDCEYTPGLSGVLSGIQSWVDETLGRIGVGASEYGPHFDGRSIDYHRPTHTVSKDEHDGRELPRRREHTPTQKTPDLSQAPEAWHDENRSKVSPAPMAKQEVKHEPEVHDMFSPVSGTPSGLRSRSSQGYDDEWVTEEVAR